MANKKSFVAIKFRPSRGRPVKMDYAYYLDEKFQAEGALVVEHPFGGCLQAWSRQFPDEILTHGCIPIIVGWGVRDREILDKLLEGEGDEQGEIAFVDRMVQYFDVEAYARREVKNLKPGDGWRQIARKVVHLDPVYAKDQKMSEPTPKACAEMMLALDRPSMVGVIARAFAEFLKVIMEDGIITTDEAKGLRSFVNVLKLKHDDPRFEALQEQLDDVLEDNVVTAEESNQLMNTLDQLRKIYEDLAMGDGEETNA